jgi:hypothetical protein
MRIGSAHSFLTSLPCVTAGLTLQPGRPALYTGIASESVRRTATPDCASLEIPPQGNVLIILLPLNRVVSER